MDERLKSKAKSESHLFASAVHGCKRGVWDRAFTALWPRFKKKCVKFWSMSDDRISARVSCTAAIVKISRS